MPQPDLSPSALAIDGPFRHRLIHTHGTRLHIAEAGENTAPLLLLIHDAWSGWYAFRLILEPLARRGWHAVAVDLRGFGLSDKPPRSLGYNIESAVSDMAGLIHSLGHDSAVVIGLGTGASLGWTLASHHSAHVTTLMACGALHPADVRRRRWLNPRFMLKSLILQLPHWALHGLRSSLTTRYLRWFSRHYSHAFANADALNESLELRRTSLSLKYAPRSVFYAHRFFLAKLPKSWRDEPVTCPVIYIKPPYTRMSQKLRKAVRSRVGKITIDTADPLLPESHPEAFLDLVDQYLAPPV